MHHFCCEFGMSIFVEVDTYYLIFLRGYLMVVVSRNKMEKKRRDFEGEKKWGKNEDFDEWWKMRDIFLHEFWNQDAISAEVRF